ncbi:MAG: hypothetical protein ACE5FB_02835, partial [Candidatus Binatia bacterium]
AAEGRLAYGTEEENCQADREPGIAQTHLHHLPSSSGGFVGRASDIAAARRRDNGGRCANPPHACRRSPTLRTTRAG